MGRLRRTIQRGILDTLDTSIYTSDDFEVGFGDPENEQYLVSIYFVHDKKFYYCIQSYHTGLHKTYQTNKSPGSIEETETDIHHSLDEALEGINSWCNEIRNELKAHIPAYQEIDDLKDILKEHLKGHSESDEFTVAEINQLREKFADLERRVGELEQENIITKSQSEQFKEGIKQVSNDIEFYPKVTWLKTATNKIAKLVAGIGKSPEGRKILSDGARKLLNLD